jgi:predicted  nucleic acid-binding Zn-ribbon protein
MTETMGVDIGTQILNAVQGLAVRMDRLEARMDKLEARMDGLEAQVTGLKTQVTDLDSRMKRQERLMESLGGEFLKWREGLRGEVWQLRGDVQSIRGELQSLRTDMHEGFRRLNARLDLTDGTVVLLAAVLRRPRDLGEDLEKRLRALETH